jgi:Mg/Co/Ni transporter MgtE
MVDAKRHRKGIIPTRRLPIKPRATALRDIMISRVVKLPDSVTVYTARRQSALYKFLTLPIVERKNRILGIVEIPFFTAEIITIETGRKKEVENFLKHPAF